MPDRIYSTGYHVLELDGTPTGLLQSVDGGAVSARVIEELTSAGPYLKKHIGRPIYEDLVLELGFSMSRPLHEWISGAWERRSERKDGAILFCDANMEVRSRHVFREAMVAETTLPACDATSSDPAYVRIRIAPGYTRLDGGGGKVTEGLGSLQKTWLPSNFRLSIDGLDCSRVVRVEPLSVTQHVLPDPIGELREYVRESGRVDFSNLRVTLSGAHAQSWIEWHNDFLIRGNCGQEREKSGTLEYLAPNLKDVLMKVHFSNLGIFRLAQENPHPLGSSVPRTVVDLYCERMQLEAGRLLDAAPGVGAELEAAAAGAAEATPLLRAPQG